MTITIIAKKKKPNNIILISRRKILLIVALINRSLCYYNISEQKRCIVDFHETIHYLTISSSSLIDDNHMDNMKNKKTQASLFIMMAIAQCCLY